MYNTFVTHQSRQRFNENIIKDNPEYIEGFGYWISSLPWHDRRLWRSQPGTPLCSPHSEVWLCNQLHSPVWRHHCPWPSYCAYNKSQTPSGSSHLEMWKTKSVNHLSPNDASEHRNIKSFCILTPRGFRRTSLWINFNNNIFFICHPLEVIHYKSTTSM